MKKYKYSFKYITRRNGNIKTNHLYFGEESYIMSKLKQNDMTIMQLFEELTFEEAYRVKLIRRDNVNDKIETIIDSKTNKILIDL